MQTLKKRAILYNIQITRKLDMHTMVLDEGSWAGTIFPTLQILEDIVTC